MKRIFFFISLSFLIFSCGEKKAVPETPVKTGITANKDFQELRDAADKRNTAAILPFFKHADPKIRAQAALVSGSVQDTLLIPDLINALIDSSTQVRYYATWSLGQMNSGLPVEALQLQIQREDDPKTRIEVYRALAKCSLASDSLVYPQTPMSGPDTEAWLNGVYQLTLAKADDQYLDPVIPFLNFPSADIHLIASQILARTNHVFPETVYQEIESRILVEMDPEVKMALILGTRKAPKGLVDSSLHKLVMDENEHPGVRINALRSLRSGNMVPPPGMISFLNHRYEDISIEVSKWIAQYPAAVQQVLERGIGNSSARVRAEIYSAALNNEAVDGSNIQLQDTINSCKELYCITAFLKKLPDSDENIAMANAILDSASNPVILSSIAESISSWDINRGEVEKLYEKTFKKGDAGATATLATDLSYRKWGGNNALLDSILTKLELPVETETYNSIVHALNYQAGEEKYETHTPGFNHPIDWSSSIVGDEKIKALISTNRGEIEIELYPEIAPGTVIDFVRLVEEGFYNGKYFHRVVPNFVVQAGCPRGDGWGSMDYSIRSEFSPLAYTAGALGMASAGKDTESCQWFITHSPTPHLEGRYTEFGRVTKGLEVAWWIKEGDKVESITILK